MTGRLRILGPFWSRRVPVAVQPAAPAPAETLREPEAFPGVLIVTLRRDVDRLTAHAAELEAERDGVAREFAATAKMAVEIAEQLAATRRIITAQAGEIRRLWSKYEQAYRNTVLEHDRVITLQKANEDLTRELAELRREAAPYGVMPS